MTAKVPICRPLPYSLEALDLSPSSPTQALAALRFMVLSYLAEAEQRLSQVDTPDFEAWKAKGEVAMEDANQWVQETLELLESIRVDVSSHLPDFSVENLKAHLPELPDVPSIQDMRSHLPDMTDMRAKFEDVRAKFHDLDFDQPIDYLPTLLDHLQRLHCQLSADSPSAFSVVSAVLSSKLAGFMDAISEMASQTAQEIHDEGPDMIERAAHQVAEAVKHSLEGCRLLQYDQLPPRWRNNPFVTQGYRFIPIERWPLIVLSLFAFHNETLNIHTHLIPFLLWGIHCIPGFNLSATDIDTPQRLFMIFALICLGCSSVYHTMAGCAHHASMEFCSRVDYVGIGWLISASVGAVVYYGFGGHPTLRNAYLSLCFLTGLAGNIFPFMQWFNCYENRGWRILFFLTLAFSSLAPMANFAYLYSTKEMLHFILMPLLPSLASYIAGLVFYATHIPERWLSPKWRSRLDTIGVGSHSIWHCFIVLAVYQYKSALPLLKEIGSVYQ
ncbi:HlyIII-domain-containing protein [Cylindrobasidium torrendii FP15055 ss-10]|uniref:HlyIII-domain-containing protein n=1 Tax=Cylindrobasidium torrendii FP15055 ss-10 TaxID=1314674 RepID=A0A0D7B8H9_9AGAR|nr:HlyIII-domain-containing protein [Cylindrobasidium torrendii FP15055 ss-10]